jgi:hypothetical protein
MTTARMATNASSKEILGCKNYLASEFIGVEIFFVFLKGHWCELKVTLLFLIHVKDLFCF